VVSAAAAAVVAAAAPARVGEVQMRTHTFLSHLDHARIVNAIKELEAKTSGEVRVYIQRGTFKEDALPRAQKKFLELGMQKTRERNAVLIFVAPREQKFAVVGDEGIHQKSGEQFWQELVEKMRGHFQREEFTDALVEAIESAGQLLARYFPKGSDRGNELPDNIVEG
jgi:uncharacterized membrane protein